VNSLFSLKRSILALNSRDREQLILWIARGMPPLRGDEEAPTGEDELTAAQRKERRDAALQRAMNEIAERSAKRRSLPNNGR
jgi:hypothetical protein